MDRRPGLPSLQNTRSRAHHPLPLRRNLALLSGLAILIQIWFLGFYVRLTLPLWPLFRALLHNSPVDAARSAHRHSCSSSSRGQEGMMMCVRQTRTDAPLHDSGVAADTFCALSATYLASDIHGPR